MKNQIPKLTKYSFEEFKLIYDSAEKVTDRRSDLNKFNYSICTAIFLAISFLWNWSLSNAKYTFAGVLVVMLFALIAIIFTFYWIRQIKDYKILNEAKFKVINEMAANLYFKTDNEEINISSFEPFAKEWTHLEQLKALTHSRQNNKSSKILKAGGLEFFIPQAFRFIFILLFLLSFLSIAINFARFSENIRAILFLS